MCAARTHIRPPGGAGQRGQAIAEMIIASAFLLVPLFLVMTLLMKYIDMDVAVQEAARYAAFQRSVFMPSNSNVMDTTNVATRSKADIQNAVRMRFFSGGQTGISDAQNTSVNGFEYRGLWHDQSGQALVGADAATLPTLTDSASPTPQDQVVGGLFAALNLVGVGFHVDTNGLMNATVSMTPANPLGPTGDHNLATPSTLFEHLGLVFSGQDALLADGWSALDPGNVKDQVQGLVPTALISTVSSLITALDVPCNSTLNAGVFPDLACLQFGYVLVNSPDEVPADRLANYTPPPTPPNSGQLQAQEISNLITQYQSLGYSETQVTNPDGSITLTFTSGTSTITQTIYPSGCETPPVSGSTLTSSDDVQATTQNVISNLIAKGTSTSTQTLTATTPQTTITTNTNTVNNGTTYTCQATAANGGGTGTCTLADLTDSKSTWYQATVTKSSSTLTTTTKTTTAVQGGNTSTNTSTTTATVTVTANPGGGSTASTTTSATTGSTCTA